MSVTDTVSFLENANLEAQTVNVAEFVAPETVPIDLSPTSTDDKLLPPSLNKISVPTATTLNVSFSDSTFERGVKKYYVEYSTDMDFSNSVSSKTFSQPGVGRVSNLESGTTYYFRMKTKTSSGDSDWSKTLSGMTTLSMPTNVVVEPVDPTTASFSFDGVDKANGYVVSYSLSASFDSCETFVSADASGMIEGLEPDAKYYVRVKAIVDDIPDSSWSEVASITTNFVTEETYAQIRSQYSSLDLPAERSSLNIIELDSDELTVVGLKEAIAFATSNVGDDLIVVRTTDESHTITYASSADVVSIDFDASIYGSVTIVSYGAQNLTLDANSKSGVVEVRNSNSVVSFGGLTFTNGNLEGSGGGIYKEDGFMKLSNCSVSNNTVSIAGGGIHNIAGPLTLTNCSVSNNTASYGYGGGIYSGGMLTLNNCAVSGNKAYGTGGIYFYYNSYYVYDEGGETIVDSGITGNTVDYYGETVCFAYNNKANFVDCAIVENTSDYDIGGVFVVGIDSEFVNCTISKNTTEGGSVGGINVSGNSTRFLNCTISENKGSIGGVFCSAPETAEFSKCTITNNAGEYNVGGVCCYSDNTKFDECMISGNKVEEGYDNSCGGAFLYGACSTVLNCTISNNESNFCGGVLCSSDETEFVDCTISNNKSNQRDGGGICNIGNKILLTNCVVSGNVSGGDGGGIFNAHDKISLTNCVVSGNVSGGDGGGIFNAHDKISLTNCVVSGNVSGTEGGGIYSGGGRFTNCEISGNSAERGAGVYAAADITLTNSTIAGNSATIDGGGIFYDGERLSVYNTIVSANRSAGDFANIYGTFFDFSNNLIDVDPSFVVAPTFDENGVLTNANEYDLRLQHDSLAIDEGNNAYVAHGSTDLDGLQRIYNRFVDIGAYELQSQTRPAFVINDIKYNSFVVSCDAIPDTTKYIAVYSTDPDFTTYETVELNDGLGMIDGLTAETTYYVKVNVTSEYTLVSSWSKVVSITTGFTTPEVYARIRSQYAELELPADPLAFNIIDLDSDKLTPADLQAAFARATSKIGDDLIVVRTTDESNTITYASSDDVLNFGFDASIYGSVTLVSYGTKNLTLNAQNLDRVVTVNDAKSIVSFGGLNFVNGETLDNGAGIYSEGTTTLVNCAISGNQTTGGDGGGIYALNSLVAFNCEISNNQATSGGGIYAGDATTLTNCAISGNQATGGAGGGIFVCEDSTSLTNCTISGNQATGGAGGGIFVQSSLVAFNCELSNNQAASGGGIYVYEDSTTLTNCTIAGNQATSQGGIGANARTTLELYNSIVAQNNGGDLNDVTPGGSNNLIGGDPCFVVPPAFDKNGNLSNADKYDLRLRYDSPAIDAGANSYVPADSTDLDGFVRICNEVVDIGAYEFSIPSVSINDLGTDSVTVSCSAAEGATKYVFVYSTSLNFSKCKTIEQTESSCTIGDLIPGVRYYVKAKFSAPSATGESIDSPWSDVVGITTNYVTAETYAQIRSHYDGLDLPVEPSALNIIEIHSDELYPQYLQEAVYSAVSKAGDDLIVVHTTNQANTITYESSRDCLGFGFDASALGSVTIVSWGTQNLTLDAKFKNRVVTIDDSNAVVSFGGVNFVNGSTNAKGGGIYADGTTTFDHCTVAGNTVYSNNESGMYGGGIFSVGATTLVNSAVSGNTVYSDEKGEIYGGGIYSVGAMTLVNCAVSGNTVYTSGVFLDVAHVYGGGIYADGTDTTLTNCTVSGNVAYADVGVLTKANVKGGGIFTRDATKLWSCEISGNVASASTRSEFYCDGGGIYATDLTTLTNCTIAGNQATSQGGGIYNSSSIDLYNSIVTQNSGGNLFGGTSGESNNWIGKEPKFVVAPSFDDRGNLTNADSYDLRLREDSLAIDAGGNSYVVDCSTDLDGMARVCNGTVDIGAYEYTYASTIVSIEPGFNSLVVSYDAVESATKYVVAYSTDPNFVTYETAESTDLSCKLVGLASNMTYYVKVKATLDDASSFVWSESAFATTNLNVTAEEYAQIREQYASLELSEAMNDLNIIELPSGELSVAKLQETIDYVTSRKGDDLIVVRTTDDDNTIAYASCDDTLKIEFDASIYGSVTIVSYGSQNLTLDANSRSNVVGVSNSNSDVSFGGLTFANGNVDGSGGGIYKEGGVMKLSNCSVSGNIASGYGGGIYNIDGALTLSNCAVSENATSYMSGGGIYSSNGTLTLDYCVVSENVAPEGNGGGICSYGHWLSTNSEFIGNNSYSVGGVYCSDYSSDVSVFDNCKFIGNFTCAGSGGVLCNAREAEFTNCTIIGNTNGEVGGLFFNGEKLTVSNCTISDNKGYGTGGARFTTSEAATFTNCTFSDNVAQYIGGGVYGYSNGTVAFTNCTLSGNRVESYEYATGAGGGINIYCDKVILDSCTISDNESTFHGGGVYCSSRDATLVNCTISGNNVRDGRDGGVRGGGVYNIGNMDVLNCVFSNNSSSFGGGIASDGGCITLANCLVSDNTASNDGGGVWNPSEMQITNCEISGNRAEQGAGIYSGDFTLTNSTIAGNSATIDGGGIFCVGGRLSVYNTIVSANTSAGDFTNIYLYGQYFDSSNNLVGVDPAVDPIFVTPPTFNEKGELTNADEYDLRLREGCLAIDAGDNARVSEDATDLDGFPRIYNGTVDIGAYESGYVVLDAPTNVSIEAGGFFLAVSYDAVKSATKYVVAYSTDPDFATYKTAESTDVSCLIDGLNATTSYYVKIKATNEYFLDSAWSESVSATTLQEVAAPILEKVASPTENSLIVTFADPNFEPGVTNYYCECSTDPNFSTIVASKTFTQPGVGKVKGLASGAEYYFRMKTISAVGESMWSDVKSGTTQKLQSYSVTSPTLAKVASATKNSLLVTFADANFEPGVTSYYCECSTDPNFSTIAVSKTFTQPGVGKMKGLASGTEYFFRMKTISAVGESEWSEVRSGTTSGPVVPTPNFRKVASATENSLLVTFADDSYEPGVKSYCCECSTDPNFSTIAASKTFTQPGVGKMKGLSPDTTYYFRMKAVTAEGESIWSDVLSGTTLGVDL